MDAIDTTSTDLVTIDAELPQIEDISFGKEVTKTLLVSTATSAGVFGGFVVIALLTPKVKTWFSRKKTDVVIEGETEDTKESPEKD
jgi:hypothetical protein